VFRILNFALFLLFKYLTQTQTVLRVAAAPNGVPEMTAATERHATSVCSKCAWTICFLKRFRCRPPSTGLGSSATGWFRIRQRRSPGKYYHRWAGARNFRKESSFYLPRKAAWWKYIVPGPKIGVRNVGIMNKHYDKKNCINAL